ncbi:MAG: carboxypeptidase-like regulatory domain-containing protein [Acidobacteriota bacterium]
MPKTLLLALVAALLVATGCGGASPMVPDGASPTAVSILSGQVHESVVWGDPPLADALIEVTGANGLKKTGFSDDDGFYRIAAAPGSVIVTASKPGFATKASEFMLVTDTTLNFSLIPD